MDINKAKECFEKHSKSFEVWREGNVEKVWMDSDENMCIQYASGNWWHYKIDNNELIWW